MLLREEPLATPRHGRRLLLRQPNARAAGEEQAGQRAREYGSNVHRFITGVGERWSASGHRRNRSRDPEEEKVHETEVGIEDGRIQWPAEAAIEERHAFEKQTQAAHDPEVMGAPHPMPVAPQPADLEPSPANASTHVCAARVALRNPQMYPPPVRGFSIPAASPITRQFSHWKRDTVVAGMTPPSRRTMARPAGRHATRRNRRAPRGGDGHPP